MKPYLKLIRLPNLLMVGFCQYLLEYLWIVPKFQESGLAVLLDDFHFFLLVLTTLIISASGYVINDLEDYEIDKINKPRKVVINQSLSLIRVQLFYKALLIIGFALAIYLGFHVQNLGLILIYPTAIYLLWLYSKFFKKRPLIGNVVVGVFCAFVPGIILFAERAAFFELQIINPTAAQELSFLCFIYMGFAFFATMFREVVKDIEDLEGDIVGNCKTLPIILGEKKAKIIAILFQIGLLILLIIFGRWLIQQSNFIGFILFILLLGLPVLLSIKKLWFAETKHAFHNLSNLAKFIIAAGLVLLIPISIL